MHISRRALFVSLLAFAATLMIAVFTSVNVPAAAAPGGAPQVATRSHFSMSAWAFRPYSSSTTYASAVSGCMYATSSDHIFFAELPLPEGSVIKDVSFRYQNPNPVYKSYVTLFAVTGGVSASKAQAVSTPATASGVGTSPEITVTVDMSDTYYLLTWYPETASDAVQICSVQVDYLKPAVFGAFLPSVMR